MMRTQDIQQTTIMMVIIDRDYPNSQGYEDLCGAVSANRAILLIIPKGRGTVGDVITGHRGPLRILDLDAMPMESARAAAQRFCRRFGVDLTDAEDRVEAPYRGTIR